MRCKRCDKEIYKADNSRLLCDACWKDMETHQTRIRTLEVKVREIERKLRFDEPDFS